MESIDITESYTGGVDGLSASIKDHLNLHGHMWLIALGVFILIVVMYFMMKQAFVNEKYTDTNSTGSAYATPPPLPMTFSGSRVALQNSYPESGLSTTLGPDNVGTVCQPNGPNDDAFAWMMNHYGDTDPGVSGSQMFTPGVGGEIFFLNPATGKMESRQRFTDGVMDAAWGTPALNNINMNSDRVGLMKAMNGGDLTRGF
jgi:hypothetical protein